MSIQNYLQNYAEEFAHSIPDIDACEKVLVIPSMGEDQLFTVLQSIRKQNILVIVVLNAKQSSLNEIHQTNEHTRLLCKEHFTLKKQQQNITLYTTSFGQLLLIDCAHAPYFLPEKQGVGLVRKIGCDAALKLYAQGQIHSPFIYNTDGDVVLPEDYFDKELNHEGGYLMPFWHVLADETQLARMAAIYELTLHDYVAQLTHAKSPYAFHTVGSTIVVHAKTYALVRGFPKTQAGEDFYFLDKIAKISSVTQLKGKPLLIAGRLSTRVPFGTGMALTKAMALKPPVFYHPESFYYLKVWLEILEQFAHTPNDLNAHILQACASNHLDASLMLKVLEQLKVFEGIKACQAKSVVHRQRFLHTWFDALKTVRFIHVLRDLKYPSRTFEQNFSESLDVLRLSYAKKNFGEDFKIN